MQNQGQPLINAFLDQLYVLRDDMAAQTKAQADAIVHGKAAKRLLISGGTLVALAELIERQCESAIGEILATLDDIKARPDIDLQPFREQAYLRGRDIIAVIIGACDMAKWYAQIGRGSAENVIRSRLDKLYPRLEHKLRQFDAGLHRRPSSGAMNVTHNVVNAQSISGVVQQGGDGAIFHTTVEIDFTAVADAARALGAELANASDGQDRNVRQLAAEVATIQAQLAAPEPKTSILREAAKSVRTIAEQAVAGALSPAVIAAASTLASLIS